MNDELSYIEQVLRDIQERYITTIWEKWGPYDEGQAEEILILYSLVVRSQMGAGMYW
jgi:hypothetical protein